MQIYLCKNLRNFNIFSFFSSFQDFFHMRWFSWGLLGLYYHSIKIRSCNSKLERDNGPSLLFLRCTVGPYTEGRRRGKGDDREEEGTTRKGRTSYISEHGYAYGLLKRKCNKKHFKAGRFVFVSDRLALRRIIHDERHKSRWNVWTGGRRCAKDGPGELGWMVAEYAWR